MEIWKKDNQYSFCLLEIMKRAYLALREVLQESANPLNMKIEKEQILKGRKDKYLNCSIGTGCPSQHGGGEGIKVASSDN